VLYAVMMLLPVSPDRTLVVVSRGLQYPTLQSLSVCSMPRREQLIPMKIHLPS